MNHAEYILALAQIGGPVYKAMQAWGLLPQGSSRPLNLTGSGAGTRVVILGAGLAGMTTAYELRKRGYNCIILEARARTGGRCVTVRRGTKEIDTDGITQVCQFDADLYLNPGPARIPHDHITLHYCKELGVPVEVFVNYSPAAFLYTEGSGPLSNTPVRMRQAEYDTRGYACELLAKSVKRNCLQDELTPEGIDQLLTYLANEGDLKSDDLSPLLHYLGSNRSGYIIPPGAGAQEAIPGRPLTRGALLEAGFSRHLLALTAYDFQAPMFQIVGGTDHLARALERQVQDSIRRNARVTEIRKLPDGVRIRYQVDNSECRELVADYCVCTIPLTVLQSIPSDFSPAMKNAIKAVAYESAVKIGLQMKRRFWEEDEGIYGGVTRTSTSIREIWYPSYGYFSGKGVLLGCYNFGGPAVDMGNLLPEHRIDRTLEEGATIHKNYRSEYENGFSVAWQKTPFSLGAFAIYTDETRRYHYPVLMEPDDRIYLAGEHIGFLTSWMAGAFEAARFVVYRLHERVQCERIPSA